jgi:5'-methylthioadenosine phosphorylase
MFSQKKESRMAQPSARVGVIGGSGLYGMEGLTNLEELHVSTPFGDPSDTIMLGKLDDVPIAFLPRHGRGHRLSPTEVPARANIYALKSLGVEWVISVSAVGSLREDYAPLDLVIPDQLFDRTKSRANSFFEGGLVVHVAFADPFCPHLSRLLWQTIGNHGYVNAHFGGTYVCIEGPLFSTKAESRIYRQLGCDLVGMTAIPEAKLAREAELHYATIACVTDYDVWHETNQSVTVEMVVANLRHNVENAKRIIRELLPLLPSPGDPVSCSCASALDNAIMTDPALILPSVRDRYRLLIGKYLGTA